MLNPFFLQGSKSEQGLVQDLINEQIRMYGIEVYYIPRDFVTEKSVLREVIESEFKSAYPIEAYVNTFDGYGGQGTLLSKFGIQDIDDLTITISKERYENYIGKLVGTIVETPKLITRPKEGDLIYFPLGDRLFEINYVEHESPFYQLQGLYTYELRCQLFRYEDEVLDTSIDIIDDNIVDEGYSQILNVTGTGITALASAYISNGVVSRISVTNRGTGYTSVPNVSISKSPSDINAVGVATLISGIVDCDGISTDKVQAITVTNGGSGYLTAPTVIVLGGGGTGAKATSEISNGSIQYISLNNRGRGYTSPPTINFISSDVGVSSATAVAVLNSQGVIDRIELTYGGSGYTTQPTIEISPPESIVGIGTFDIGEKVIGSQSGTTGRVKLWNQPGGLLEVGTISGDFIPGETIVGTASSAEYKLISITTDDTDDKYAENSEIEIEADSILDFTEKNPFGIP